MTDSSKSASTGHAYVRLPLPLYRQIAELAKSEHRSLNGQITLAVEEHVERHNDKEDE